MLVRIVLAIVVGIAVALVCYLAGVVLATVDIDFAAAIGNFLKQWGGLIGLLAAIWWFFAGSARFGPR